MNFLDNKDSNKPEISHYFSETEHSVSNPQTFTYSFRANTYTFTTDTGVFSVGKMDKATDILLHNIPPLQGSLLDMGCGYGAIGIVLGKEYNLNITQIDINPRAVRLTQKNAAKNGVVSRILHSNIFSQFSDPSQASQLNLFDSIVINPPIHAGKNVIFDMYEASYTHLNNDGRLFIVILKKHGADSTIAHLTKLFGNCETLYKKKGYHILCSTKIK